LKLQTGVIPSMGLPAASFATARKRITSPVRASDASGVTVSEATADGRTWTAIACCTAPTLAVIVARPAATAVTTPTSFTRAMAGADDRHITLSSRRSFFADSTSAPSRMRCPGTSRDGVGLMAMRAAGPGTIRTSNCSTFGASPGMMPTTVMGSVPVDPDTSVPSSRICPSKRAMPLRVQRNVTFGMTLLFASRASARNRTESPATTTFCTGETTIRAMRDWGWPLAGAAPCCADSANGARTRSESSRMKGIRVERGGCAPIARGLRESTGPRSRQGFRGIV
jgi:hypothetical protein